MLTLREALDSTCEKRGSQAVIARWAEVLDDVASDEAHARSVGKVRAEEPLCEGDLASGLLRYSKGDSRQHDGLGMISYVIVTQRDPRECPELPEKP